MNRVSFFEIPSKDLERSKKFYTDLFGWQLNNLDEDNIMATTTQSDENGQPTSPGAINGSIFRATKIGAANFVIEVDDIDAYLKKIEEAGGKIAVPKTDVPGMGSYARFLDPDKNTVGIWQNTQQ